MRLSVNLKIRELRIERKISLRELASKSKVSKGYLSDLEDPICTKNNPSISTLCKIADGLGVKPCMLYECKEDLSICNPKSID